MDAATRAQILADRKQLKAANEAARKNPFCPPLVAWGLEGDCEGCHGPLPPQLHQGNPRRWCSDACRIRTTRARRRARDKESA